VNRYDVVASYALEIVFSDRNEPPHPLILVETEGNWPKLSGEISELAAAVVPELILDVMAIDRNRPDSRLAEALATTPPFFQRKSTE